MTKKRLIAIEEKASRMFTTSEILNEVIRPIFQAADASVTNAEHLASFKAQVLTIVSQHLNIPVEVVREFFFVR